MTWTEDDAASGLRASPGRYGRPPPLVPRNSCSRPACDVDVETCSCHGPRVDPVTSPREADGGDPLARSRGGAGLLTAPGDVALRRAACRHSRPPKPPCRVHVTGRKGARTFHVTRRARGSALFHVTRWEPYRAWRGSRRARVRVRGRTGPPCLTSHVKHQRALVASRTRCVRRMPSTSRRHAAPRAPSGHLARHIRVPNAAPGTTRSETPPAPLCAPAVARPRSTSLQP